MNNMNNNNITNKQQFNYCTDNITLYGMMNKNCSFYPYMKRTFYKTKSKNNIVICNPNLNFINNIANALYMDSLSKNTYKKISFMYCNDNIKDKLLENSYIKDNYSISSYKEEEIVSVLNYNYFEYSESKDFMTGKEFKELRPYIKRYKNIIKVRNIYNSKDDVIEMLDKWKDDESCGKKYGIRCRVGVDKALVERYVKEKLGESLIGFAFYTYNKELNKDICIGYAITARNPIDIVYSCPVFSYMCRKVLNNIGYRNLTEYIDWYVFNHLYTEYCSKFNRNLPRQIFINWGCSSGGVKWYKEHKWPLYKKETKWFYTLKYKEQNK